MHPDFPCGRYLCVHPRNDFIFFTWSVFNLNNRLLMMKEFLKTRIEIIWNKILDRDISTELYGAPCDATASAPIAMSVE